MSKSKKNQLKQADHTNHPPEEFPDGPVGAPTQKKKRTGNKK